MFILRLIWQARYACLARQSGYEISMSESWEEAVASWDMNQHERCGSPMPTPEEALRHDIPEWLARA